MQRGIVVVSLFLAAISPVFAQAPAAPPQPASPRAATVGQPVVPPPPSAQPSSPRPSQETMDIVNNASLDDRGPKGGVSPAILRAEVMLDRLHFSPGVIDGRRGRIFVDALALYEKTRRLAVTRRLDRKVWSALVAESPGPVLEDYTTTDADVAGPFLPDIPRDYAKQAKLARLAYRSPAQKLAAKFHMSEKLLAALNPGVDLGKAGTTLLVADVAPVPFAGRLASIVVDKRRDEVIALGRGRRILAAYPATIGSRELPSPSGTYRVKGVAWNPIYYYNPKNFVQGDNHEKLRLPPGPNNPVGSVFIALTKPTYGLHGTPDPDEIGKTASHGCVRMTNWDARQLAHLVHPGIVVRFVGHR